MRRQNRSKKEHRTQDESDLRRHDSLKRARRSNASAQVTRWVRSTQTWQSQKSTAKQRLHAGYKMSQIYADMTASKEHGEATPPRRLRGQKKHQEVSYWFHSSALTL